MSASDVNSIVDTIGGWVVGIIVMVGLWKAFREQ